MVRYRDRLDIIADVLEVAKGGARNMGLVRREDGSIFKLTEKGSDFLQEFYGYREHLGEVEERLSDIEYMKAMLVNKYLNDERVR
jgi:predicted transcriptional regulator